MSTFTPLWKVEKEMTNRTSSQAVKKQLASNIKNGHPSFKVLSAAPARSDELHHYIIAVPTAVMRSGITGWISKRIISEWGKPTEFGSDLFWTVNRISGVELSLNNDYPHVVQIFTDDKLEKSDPPSSLRYVTRGLPVVVCERIEEVILRNSSPGQRFAEWLRRLV